MLSWQQPDRASELPGVQHLPEAEARILLT